MTNIEIHQFSSNLSYGDAISNDILEVQSTLQKWGYSSKIYAQHVDPRVKNHFNLYTDYKGNKNNIIIFHASIGGNIFDYVKNLPDKKILIYHNITPAHFFEGYNPTLYALLNKGEDLMRDIMPHINFAVGDSEFNEKDLKKFGYKNTDTLPIFFNPSKFDIGLNMSLQKDLKKDNFKNILFVGRFCPNKKQDDLIKAFYIYNKYFNEKSRLNMIGNPEGCMRYYLQLKTLIEELNLQNKVSLGTHVNFQDMITYYKSADLFLCMSEHEGFFVPVLESFYLGLPMMAYNTAALPYTMADAGILFDKKDYKEIAEKMDLILSNVSFRNEIISKQHERFKNFSRDKVEAKLKQIIEKVL